MYCYYLYQCGCTFQSSGNPTVTISNFLMFLWIVQEIKLNIKMNWTNGVLNVGQIDSILILPLKVVSKKRCVIVARACTAQLILHRQWKKMMFYTLCSIYGKSRHVGCLTRWTDTYPNDDSDKVGFKMFFREDLPNQLLDLICIFGKY
jgi:hypothetical protein